MTTLPSCPPSKFAGKAPEKCSTNPAPLGTKAWGTTNQYNHCAAHLLLTAPATSLGYLLPAWGTSCQRGVPPASLRYLPPAWGTSYQPGVPCIALGYLLAAFGTSCQSGVPPINLGYLLPAWGTLGTLGNPVAPPISPSIVQHTWSSSPGAGFRNRRACVAKSCASLRTLGTPSRPLEGPRSPAPSSTDGRSAGRRRTAPAESTRGVTSAPTSDVSAAQGLIEI